jgi:hypothetical protein
VTAFFLLQMLVCLLTVIRVDGFHFGELAADFATAEGSRKGSGDQRCRGGGNLLASILGESGNESHGDRRSRAIQESGKSLMPIMDQIGPKYICCKYSGSILRKSVRHP